MYKIFLLSAFGLLAMIGLAVFASSHKQDDRAPAGERWEMPKDIHHSAKY